MVEARSRLPATDSSGGATWHRALALALASYALVGGLVSFLGWPANIPRLTDWDNTGISIQPNASLAAIGSGAALLLLSFGIPRPAAAVGVLVGLIGASTLFQYLTGFNLEFINTLLMFDRPWGRVGVVYPGRMGPPGATCWTLIGMALALAAVRGGAPRRAIAPITLVTLGIAALSITGYLYGADTLYTLPYLTVIALQTATFIAAVSLALFTFAPESSPLRWLVDSGAAGAVARLAVPFVILVPFLVGWLRLTGEVSGLYDTRFGVAMLVLLLTAILLGFMAWTLRIIARHEAALRDADRRKDEFLATLAHELRGPLAPVMNGIEILDRAGSDTSTAQEARNTMRRQLGQMVRLIDDLLDVSRITQGKLELRKERIELRAVIKQATESCGPLVEGLKHELTVTLPPETIVLDADPARLAQVFGNLFNNACKYTEPQGHVWVSAERQGGVAVIRVQDSGIGIPPEKLGSIFDMFSQVGRSLEQTHGGLGIGLHLVKRLVELHGGTVEAHSQGPGQGSEFVVRLPLPLVAPRVDAPAGLAAPRISRPRRVLVVDDNVDAAASLALLLKLHGNDTYTAHDGLEAVAAAKKWRPDIVLLDIGLPKLNGYDACRQIRAQSWGDNMVIVALTGWGQDEDRRKSQEAGFDEHLVKPVRSGALAELFGSVASKRESRVC